MLGYFLRGLGRPGGGVTIFAKALIVVGSLAALFMFGMAMRDLYRHFRDGYK
jgi:hypothetical protein